MFRGLPLFPDSASSMAGRVDALFFFLLGVCGFIALLIFVLIVVFSIKFRRRAPNEIGAPIGGSLRLETIWSVVPLILAMVMFAWGADLYVQMRRPPTDAMNIYVVAKQWMWKLQHSEGQMEINELHVPLGRDIKLTMTSEDVIHDFFVPAFRVKADVLPGRYTTIWFHPTKTGRFHLFCAQYCGTGHARMGGWITVMAPPEFEAWLSGGAKGESLQAAGERLFERNSCGNCHPGKGPPLAGLFGSTVHFRNGTTAVADDAYIRESLLNPGAKVVRGYDPVMPTFQGQLKEQQLLELIAYIRSLSSVSDEQDAVSVTKPGQSGR